MSSSPQVLLPREYAQLATASATASEPRAHYRLTITNTNEGSELLAAGDRATLCGLGDVRDRQPATVEFWRLAEGSSTAEFEALADSQTREVIVVQSVHRRDSPVFTTTFEAPPELLLSVAAMLSLTNDGLVAARSARG